MLSKWRCIMRARSDARAADDKLPLNVCACCPYRGSADRQCPRVYATPGLQLEPTSRRVWKTQSCHGITAATMTPATASATPSDSAGTALRRWQRCSACSRFPWKRRRGLAADVHDGTCASASLRGGGVHASGAGAQARKFAISAGAKSTAEGGLIHDLRAYVQAKP